MALLSCKQSDQPDYHRAISVSMETSKVRLPNPHSLIQQRCGGTLKGHVQLKTKATIQIDHLGMFIYVTQQFLQEITY